MKQPKLFALFFEGRAVNDSDWVNSLPFVFELNMSEPKVLLNLHRDTFKEPECDSLGLDCAVAVLTAERVDGSSALILFNKLLIF